MATSTAQWTAERIRDLGATTDLVTAGRVLGISRTTVYDLARREELPFPVLRLGKRFRVPTSGLLAALGMNDPAA